MGVLAYRRSGAGGSRCWTPALPGLLRARQGRRAMWRRLQRPQRLPRRTPGASACETSAGPSNPLDAQGTWHPTVWMHTSLPKWLHCAHPVVSFARQWLTSCVILTADMAWTPASSRIHPLRSRQEVLPRQPARQQRRRRASSKAHGAASCRRRDCRANLRVIVKGVTGN